MDNKDKTYVDFGFLPTHLGFETDDWEIQPLSDYTERREHLRKMITRDGFLYPPRSQWCNSDGVPLDEPSTPGNLLKVPASHRIARKDGAAFDQEFDSESLFITQCLGLLYDQRVTIERWWLDKRVEFPKGNWGDVFYHVGDDYLEALLKGWRVFSKEDRYVINSLIMMHLRHSAYTWDFERFTFSFMIIDGLYKIALAQGLLTKQATHGERLKELMTLTCVKHDKEKVRMIIDIRNNLFHEVKWDKGHPLSVTGHDGLQCSLWLPKLIQRLLIGFLGYQNKWVSSPWWIGGNYYFDRISNASN